MTTKSPLETLPFEIRLQMIAASVLPLGQVYLAARKETLRAALSICKDNAYRKKATGLTIEVIMYAEGAHREPNLLQAMYLAKKELRKPDFRQWKPYLAKKEYMDLCISQNELVRDGYSQRFCFHAVLERALTRLENIETIRITDRFSNWFYSEGPLSWDIKFTPFPAMSTVYTLGTFTIALMEKLWKTRQTRSPKMKLFIADIVGDLNGRREVTGLPYDAILWGVKQMAEFDESILQLPLKGFEELSIDISLRRFWSGYGGPANSRKKHATVAQKRTEWLGIGKIIAGAESLTNLDLRFRDSTLDRRYFKDCFLNLHWVNLSSLRLCNFFASAEDLWHVLATHVKLETLVLERAAIIGESRPTLFSIKRD